MLCQFSMSNVRPFVRLCVSVCQFLVYKTFKSFSLCFVMLCVLENLNNDKILHKHFIVHNFLVLNSRLSATVLISFNRLDLVCKQKRKVACKFFS